MVVGDNETELAGLEFERLGAPEVRIGFVALERSIHGVDPGLHADGPCTPVGFADVCAPCLPLIEVVGAGSHVLHGVVGIGKRVGLVAVFARERIECEVVVYAGLVEDEFVDGVDVVAEGVGVVLSRGEAYGGEVGVLREEADLRAGGGVVVAGLVGIGVDVVDEHGHAEYVAVEVAGVLNVGQIHLLEVGKLLDVELGVVGNHVAHGVGCEDGEGVSAFFVGNLESIFVGVGVRKLVAAEANQFNLLVGKVVFHPASLLLINQGVNLFVGHVRCVDSLSGLLLPFFAIGLTSETRGFAFHETHMD